jgi:hypothetical protein
VMCVRGVRSCGYSTLVRGLDEAFLAIGTGFLCDTIIVV